MRRPLRPRRATRRGAESTTRGPSRTDSALIPVARGTLAASDQPPPVAVASCGASIPSAAHCIDTAPSPDRQGLERLADRCSPCDAAGQKPRDALPRAGRAKALASVPRGLTGGFDGVGGEENPDKGIGLYDVTLNVPIPPRSTWRGRTWRTGASGRPLFHPLTSARSGRRGPRRSPGARCAGQPGTSCLARAASLS